MVESPLRMECGLSALLTWKASIHSCKRKVEIFEMAYFTGNKCIHCFLIEIRKYARKWPIPSEWEDKQAVAAFSLVFPSLRVEHIDDLHWRCDKRKSSRFIEMRSREARWGLRSRRVVGSILGGWRAERCWRRCPLSPIPDTSPWFGFPVKAHQAPRFISGSLNWCQTCTGRASH